MPARGKPYALPPYPYRHQGRCIVVGSAGGVFQEFKEAREHWPDAGVIAVNEAIGYFKTRIVCTLHREKLHEFRDLARERWGADFAPTFHLAHTRDYEQQPGVYAWPYIHTGGTSGWAGAKLAEALGFNEILLCGCPLDARFGYAWRTALDRPGAPRIGQNETVAMRHLRAMKDDIAQGIGQNVRSMSGRTKALLGGPKWQSQE